MFDGACGGVNLGDSRARASSTIAPMPRGGSDPKLEALARVPLFQGFRKRDLVALGRIADEIDRPAGKEVIREGDVGRQFFVILAGEARVRRRGRTVNTLGPGAFFGEIALLANRPTTASVTATTPLRLVVLTRPNFNRLMRTAPDMQWSVIQALVERVPVES